MDIRNVNIISLAYLGDSVYEVYIREYLIKKSNALVYDIQRDSIKYVSAKGQSKIVIWLIEKDYLSDTEIDIFKRGRNYKRSNHPKNTDIITYKNATGFEGLIGYLYLVDIVRLDEIMKYILEVYNEEDS